MDGRSPKPTVGLVMGTTARNCGSHDEAWGYGHRRVIADAGGGAARGGSRARTETNAWHGVVFARCRSLHALPGRLRGPGGVSDGDAVEVLEPRILCTPGPTASCAVNPRESAGDHVLFLAGDCRGLHAAPWIGHHLRPRVLTARTKGPSRCGGHFRPVSLGVTG